MAVYSNAINLVENTTYQKGSMTLYYHITILYTDAFGFTEISLSKRQVLSLEGNLSFREFDFAVVHCNFLVLHRLYTQVLHSF